MRDSDPLIESALSIAATEEQMAGWILDTLRTGTVPGTEIRVDPACVGEVLISAFQLETFPKERFRAGLILAIRSWIPGVYPLSLIAELAVIAAATSTSSVAIDLGQHIVSLIEMSGDDEVLDTLHTVGASLSGLAPSERVESVLLRLFLDDRIAENIGGSLFVGLSICGAENFVRLVDRLIALAERRPENFHLPVILASAIRRGPRPGQFFDLLPTIDLDAGKQIFTEIAGAGMNLFGYYPAPSESQRQDSDDRFIGQFDDDIVFARVPRHYVRKALELSYHCLSLAGLDGLTSDTYQEHEQAA